MSLSDFYIRVCGFFKSRLNNNTRYAWYVIRKERYHFLSEILHSKYSPNTLEKPNEQKIVYCPFEGNLEGGGLADRLRGVLSTYSVCRQLNVPFRLVFNHPFKLQDYLEPNQYDWLADGEELRYDIPKENIFILDATQDSPYQKRQQRKWLLKHIKEGKGQIHVYTNAAFSYDYGYHEMFNALFKPTEKLQSSIDHYLSNIGPRYISISCRFLNMFGDFNETHGYTKTLTEEKKESVISSVLSQIEELHQKHLGCKILCNSDSITFLNRCNGLDYTYVIPGEVTHIDSKEAHGDYKKYEKTFIDFFMIAHAEHIYILKTAGMHVTGYPYAASFIYEKPLDVIRF